MGETQKKDANVKRLKIDEPDPTFTTENTSVMLFRTNFQNYEFVMALNDAFGLRLTRIGRQTVAEYRYPYFFYFDEVTKLTYLTFDADHKLRKNDVFSQYDKMLVIRGRDAWKKVLRIYDEIMDPSMTHDEEDMFQQIHYENVEALRKGIFIIDGFSFSRKQGPMTTLNHGQSGSIPKSATTRMNSIKRFTLEVLNYLNKVTYEDEGMVVFFDKEEPVIKVIV